MTDSTPATAAQGQPSEDLAAEIARAGTSGWIQVDNDGTFLNVQTAPALPSSVGRTEREWTAMLWDTVSWRPVGTTGDRQHALNEVRDWLRDGIRPEERICIAHRDLGPWWPEAVKDA